MTKLGLPTLTQPGSVSTVRSTPGSRADKGITTRTVSATDAPGSTDSNHLRMTPEMMASSTSLTVQP